MYWWTRVGDRDIHLAQTTSGTADDEEYRALRDWIKQITPKE